MNVEKTIKANNVFIIIQALLFAVDIILSFTSDISIYFIFMWICGLICVVYNGFVQSLFRYKVIHKRKNYTGIMRKHPYAFTDLKIYKLSKKIKDFKTSKILEQGFISVGIFMANIMYILIITALLHPESIA